MEFNTQYNVNPSEVTNARQNATHAAQALQVCGVCEHANWQFLKSQPSTHI